MYYWSLHMQFIMLKLQGIAQYRKSFVLGAIAQFLMYGAQFLMLWIIIEKFKTINGWQANEVLFLYGLNLGTYALAGFFFNPITSQLPQMIQNGTFDEVLTKPVNTLAYLVCRDFNTAYFSHLGLSAIVVIYALYELNIQFTMIDSLFFIAVIIGGMLIQSAALLITATPAFWIVNSGPIQSVLFFEMTQFIRYPLSIYNKIIQFILTFVLPYSFINYYPANYLLGKQETTLFHSSFQYLTPIVGIVMFIAAYVFWKIGIRNYTSTGS